MIDAARLLADLQGLRRDLEDDLRERCEELPEREAALREEHREARAGGRTAETWNAWRDERLTQVAVAWILGCVFVRFLEDNALVDPPRLSGPGDRRQRALDEHTLYFRAQPVHSDRDYLLHVFRAVAALPAAGPLFDQPHNPCWSGDAAALLSGDAAARMLAAWQRIDPDTGALAHDFTDPARGTRFLGDLYQDLSESARKRYALLQTPEFVEEFILDRTLDPAVETFGFREVRLIDPACGSGHFLLGAFRRLDTLWAKHEPGANPRERAARVLDQLAGVDVNPYAAAIARFRLCIAALTACNIRRLADAPAFPLHVAAGDSLLHGPRPGLSGARQEFLDPDADPLGHVYRTEDRDALRPILGRRYHVVVGNPPYITPKDKALNEAYRGRFGSCYRAYSLAVPFTERFFDLAHESARDSAVDSAGFVGMITANSFMKREFGKKLIEKFLPRWDLTHVVDTSGAYIPGHGTPTVILFGRHRPPVAGNVRAVMGIRGEPATPDDPAQGLVWSAIVRHIDQGGSAHEFGRVAAASRASTPRVRELSPPWGESAFVSVSDVARERFHKHPWSIGGGGAAELKALLDGKTGRILGDLCAEPIGITSFTLEDDIYLFPADTARRRGLPDDYVREMVVGETVRDWGRQAREYAAFPYGADFQPIPHDPNEAVLRYLWPARTNLANNRMFGGKTKVQAGLEWYEYGRLTSGKLRVPLSITFAFVATHNHFVLDRGGKVFNRSAPVIKLPDGSNEGDHLGLLGLLNSSTACFWGRESLFPKGGYPDGRWQERLEWDGTKLQRFPVPTTKPLGIARRLDALAQQHGRALPVALVSGATPVAPAGLAARTRGGETRGQATGDQTPIARTPQAAYTGPGRVQTTARKSSTAPHEQTSLTGHEETRAQSVAGQPPTAAGLQAARTRAREIREQMIALQEELDWRCYRLYGLTEDDLCMPGASDSASWRPTGGASRGEPVTDVPAVRLGERAFEIVLARRMAAGEVETKWFERHGSTPVIEIPERWPADYRALVQRRIEAIGRNASIALIEQPEYKRRWNDEPWAAQQERALRGWLLDRLEAPALWAGTAPRLTTASALADRMRDDAEFVQAAELYAGRADFDMGKLVATLVEGESVPLLPVLRCKPSGLRKRADWERTWDLQRQEDAIDARTGLPADDPQRLTPEQAAAVKAQDVGTIPVPPRYTSADFRKGAWWRLRGKLDVPKERFVSLPHCARDADPSLVIAWAGWNALQQTQAIAEYYERMRTQEGWTTERLTPLLAGLLELLPWVRQHHNALDPQFGVRMGDYFADFLDTECRTHALTRDALRAWTPPPAAARRRGRGRRST